MLVSGVSIKWLFWLAAVVLLLLATLGMAAVVPGLPVWLFPAGVLALTLALIPVP